VKKKHLKNIKRKTKPIFKKPKKQNLKKLPCCQKLYLTTLPHLLIPHLDIQIWNNVKNKHNKISSKKLGEKRKKKKMEKKEEQEDKENQKMQKTKWGEIWSFCLSISP
jgi:hypothetical protein